jgi:predicted hydrocarbon binding protein
MVTAVVAPLGRHAATLTRKAEGRTHPVVACYQLTDVHGRTLMNRKQFLKDAACGVCVSAAASLVPAADLAAAGQAKTDDWRLPFVKRRYAKLWEILSGRMDDTALEQTLHELGTYCSSLGDEWIKKHHGDFESFRKSIQESKSGDTVTYDRERNVMTMASDVRTECFCPLNGENISPVICNCSLGWQQHTWETFLQRKVKVELKESVLRGGKRCVFEISADDATPDKLLG